MGPMGPHGAHGAHGPMGPWAHGVGIFLIVCLYVLGSKTFLDLDFCTFCIFLMFAVFVFRLCVFVYIEKYPNRLFQLSALLGGAKLLQPSVLICIMDPKLHGF